MLLFLKDDHLWTQHKVRNFYFAKTVASLKVNLKITYIVMDTDASIDTCRLIKNMFVFLSTLSHRKWLKWSFSLIQHGSVSQSKSFWAKVFGIAD